MKKILILLVGFMVVMSAVSYAKPEHYTIKEASQKSREKNAKVQLKNVKLSQIEDPEARKAIREILNYLNLQG